MLHPLIFGGERSEKRSGASPDKTLILHEVQPEMGRGLLVRRVFAHFQNLNLLFLIEDLRRGRVTRGNWSLGGDLCPVSHGLPNGNIVSVLRYLSQAVNLSRACQQAAEEMNLPPRFVEHFVMSWDGSGISEEWLREQLELLWTERQADADAVQGVLINHFTDNTRNVTCDGKRADRHTRCRAT